MSGCYYDPFKWAEEPLEDIEEYQKQFKEDAKKIIEEMEECLQQKNDGKTLKDTKDYTKYQAQAE